MKLTIETNEKIRGGQVCLPNTRVPVWLIMRHFDKGYSDKEILKFFDELSEEWLSVLKRLLLDFKEHK